MLEEKKSPKEKEITLESQRIKKMNKYHFISIPKALVDNNLLSLTKKYKVIFIETNENNTTNAESEDNNE